MIVRNWRLLALAFGVLGTGACREPTAPDEKVSITAQAGDGQYATSASTLADPLQVIVTDPVTKRAVGGITVEWRVVQGNGASILPSSSVTRDDGIATAVARVGTDLGTYVFEATADNLVGEPAHFEARAVLPPRITSLSPRSANTSDTV